VAWGGELGDFWVVLGWEGGFLIVYRRREVLILIDYGTYFD